MSEPLDLLPDGVVVADGAGTVVQLNRVARIMLAGTAEVGRPLGDVLALVDQDGRSWFDCNQPYQGLTTRTGVPEQPWLLPNGSEVLVTAHISRAAVDRPIDGVGVVLRSGRGRARLDRERSDLVATVAHELRSPLTGVKGFVQAMLNRWDKLSDAQKKLMLTTVSVDSERLSRLIAELLDVARIDTGRLSLYRRPCDVEVLVNRVVAAATIGTTREVIVEAGPELPEVHLDPDKFIQVLSNLVENALRHGEGIVRIRLARSEESTWASGVRVDVDDEGDGIHPEMRRRAFTKFWKHGERGGSGLGLYLVNGLVAAHGGTVAIGTSPGGGARITLELPAEQSPV